MRVAGVPGAEFFDADGDLRRDAHAVRSIFGVVEDVVLDEAEEVVGGDGHGARDAGATMDSIGVLGRPACVGDESDVDGQGGEALGDAVVSESVLIGVPCGVAGLGRVAVDAGEGRKHDEEVEVKVAGQEVLVQVPGALDFGIEVREESFEGHVHEDCILFSS